jgi:spore coat protein A, manganese oxidase
MLKNLALTSALILLFTNTALATVSWRFQNDMQGGMPTNPKGVWAFMQNALSNNNPAKYTLLPTYQKRCDLSRWSVPADPFLNCWQDLTADSLIAGFTQGTPYVKLHPGINNQVIVRWQSPVAGNISLTGRIADIDPACVANGDGIKWSIRTEAKVLKAGIIANAKTAAFFISSLPVKKSERLYFVIDKDKNNFCDATSVDVDIRQLASIIPASAVPDLVVTLAQPMPALTTTALSEIPVTITNHSTKMLATPLTLTMSVPATIEMPVKFVRNADAWVCINKAATKVLTCHYSKSLAAHDSTTLRLPVVPTAATLGSLLKPLILKVAAVANEKDLSNNTASLTPTAVVKAWQLDPKAKDIITVAEYSKPLLRATAISRYAYTLPLPNMLAPDFQFKPDTKTVSGTDLYKLNIDRMKTYILPPGFPATQVFAYGDCDCMESFSYPAHTIVANSIAAGYDKFKRGRSTKIKFEDKRDPDWPHVLPVDHSIHGAMDGEPDIRSVVHLHGFKKVNEDSDGYPEAWKSPSGKTIADTGYEPIVTVPHNNDPFDQNNEQEASLLWFHDHTLGITRLNVYAGLAGLYVLRDSHEENLIKAHILPHDAYEIPLVLQDRMFHNDGSLAYPNRIKAKPKAPLNTMSPEFFGDVMMVNGVAWPYLEVEPRRYRFRVLNGSNARFYNLALSNKASFQVIGSEGGFLNSPVTVNSLTIAPGERYDVVIDFSGVRGKILTLKNSAEVPFGNAEAKPPINGAHMDEMMQFRVNQGLSKVPNKPLPNNFKLRPKDVAVLKPTSIRQVLLAETTDPHGRTLPILGTVKDGIKSWMEAATETPKAWSTETWEIFNTTGDAHPIHLHGGHFQIVNRQPFSAGVLGKNGSLPNRKLLGLRTLAKSYETAWKDTVIAPPGQVTRINVKFENAGLFVWHCHILEHEDHDMMRPLSVQ